MRRLAALVLLLLGLGLVAPSHAQVIRDPENTLIMELEGGRVVIAMRPDLAPRHVARIKELTRKGFYVGVVFHRVIRGFMGQTEIGRASCRERVLHWV